MSYVDKKLPTPVATYDPQNENIMRRQVEQNFRDIRNDMAAMSAHTDKATSLALRRFQFLLMGAKNG